MLTTYLVFILAVTLVTANIAIQRSSFQVADYTLRVAIKNAEPVFNTQFDEGLRTSPILPWGKTSQLVNNNIFWQINADTALELENIDVVSAPQLKLTSVKADLESLNLALEGSVGTVIMDGNFTVSSVSSLKTFPLFSEGNFRLLLESVSFEGRTGLKVNGDNFLTVNYDVDYIPAHVTLIAQYYSARGPLMVEISTKGFDNDLRSKIKTHLRSFLNKHLQKHFDVICSKQSLKKLLVDDDTAIANYMSHARSLTANVNKYVDELLAELNKQTVAGNKCSVRLPVELQASFSKKVLDETWHGSFTATRPWVKDLCSIQRTGDMTLAYDGGVSTVFGAVGFSKLQAGFDNYYAEFMDFAPSGTLIATASSPSLFFKVGVNSKVLTAVTVTAKQLYIESVRDIDLDVTGLGDLKWLEPKISSWVPILFTDRITPYINDYLKDFASTSVTLVNPLRHFHE